MFEKEKCDYTDLLLIKNKLLRKLDIVYIDTQSLRLKYESKRYTCLLKNHKTYVNYNYCHPG